MKKTIKKLPKSQVSIEVSVPTEIFETYRVKAIARLGEHVELPGFRKGKAPADIVEKALMPMAVMEEMAGMAINDHFSKILVDEKIDAIGRPEIQVTKVAPGNPFEFTATVAVVPEVKIPDYKKLAAKTNGEKQEITISDEELETGIKELKKARAHQELEHKDEKHDHAEFDKLEFDATLTDEYVKSLGMFESVEDFKTKFRANMQREKEQQAKEKRRIAILEAILEKTDVEMPQVLIESELEQLIGRLKADVSNIGISFDEYLKHINKTEEDIRTEFLPDAEKRAKMELIMHKIGTTENIAPKQEDIDGELMKLMSMYKDADENRARIYVTHLLANEAIFRFLEEQN